MFDLVHPDQHGQLTTVNYKQELYLILQEVFKHIVSTLELSKQKLQECCNRNLRFYDFAIGQDIWLKFKHYKAGENRKLALRRDVPWMTVRKPPNGVIFEIANP